ncbi:MAG: carboxylating nicotinate-nucleotide diphosphorylase [Candidatus Omnitrophica bacterium]|nr:carboxylating nicotinate-nucleotide diphosphorylase [Candidatus Omnitrophota bacterium]
MRSSKKNTQVLSDISIIVSNALAEDIGSGDITCAAVIAQDVIMQADIYLKEKNIVVCGLEMIKEVFSQIDQKVKVKFNVAEGAYLTAEKSICTIIGPAISILKGERTALNFLGRLSGIATKTQKISQLIKKYKAIVLDTRKTTPGLRILEKYAVKTGGGANHRFGLFDQILIKDNHIQIMRDVSGYVNLSDMIKQVRKKTAKQVKLEIEVTSLAEFKDAIQGKPDIIMLDNMNIIQMKQAVSLRNKTNKRVLLEASGNVTEKNIAGIAACGVDFISLGSLTHSFRCIDFSLKTK